MKKILFRSLAACLLLFGVAGCGEPEIPNIDDTENNGENNDNPGNDNQDNENPGNEDEENPEAEEFIVQAEDNGLSVSADRFELAKSNPEDSYIPEFSIVANTDSSWYLVTALNERETKLVSENQDVIPDSALTMKFVKNSDIVGASGSNEIEQIKIVIDRKAINPGETKIKLVVKPNNGSSSVMKLTTICVNVKVYAYGEIPINTYNLDFDLDLTGLEDILNKGVDLEYAQFSISDLKGSDYYGFAYDDIYSQEIPLDNIPEKISFTDFKFAKDHEYNVQIFVEAKEVKNRMWIQVEEASSGTNYEITNTERSSTIKLTGDASVKAKIGDIFQI